MAIELKKLILNASDILKTFHLIQLQDNTSLSISQISNLPFARGVFLTVSLTTGQDNIINHGLDRPVQGWTTVNKNANSDIWQSTSVNNFEKKQIILRSSANVTAKIYFF